MVATSIGVAVKGLPVVGVIYNPFLEQLVSFLVVVFAQADRQYSAAKGRGAYLNESIQLPITGAKRPLASLGEAL